MKPYLLLDDQLGRMGNDWSGEDLHCEQEHNRVEVVVEEEDEVEPASFSQYLNSLWAQLTYPEEENVSQPRFSEAPGPTVRRKAIKKRTKFTKQQIPIEPTRRLTVRERLQAAEQALAEKPLHNESGWELHVDPTSGRRYWHHRPTGASQWLSENRKPVPVLSEPRDDCDAQIFEPRWQREAAKARNRKPPLVKSSQPRPILSQPPPQLARCAAADVVFGEPKDDNDFRAALRWQVANAPSPPIERTPLQQSRPHETPPPHAALHERAPSPPLLSESPRPQPAPKVQPADQGQQRHNETHRQGEHSRRNNDEVEQHPPMRHAFAPWLDVDAMRRRSQSVHRKWTTEAHGTSFPPRKARTAEEERALTRLLIDSIRRQYGDETLATFHAKAKEFARGDCDAHAYLSYLVLTFGPHRTAKVVRIIAELLHNDRLRRALLLEYDKLHETSVPAPQATQETHD